MNRLVTIIAVLTLSGLCSQASQAAPLDSLSLIGDQSKYAYGHASPQTTGFEAE